MTTNDRRVTNARIRPDLDGSAGGREGSVDAEEAVGEYGGKPIVGAAWDESLIVELTHIGGLAP
jgi:hypothetical protein